MRPSAAKAGHRLDGFTYGLKPVPFRMFLGGKFFQRSFDGLRPIFFGPCTLRRTWGTRPGDEACGSTANPPSINAAPWQMTSW